MEREDFYIGQKLNTPMFLKEEWDDICEDFVTVSEINDKYDIVHIEMKLKNYHGFTCHSGMYFKDAVEYKNIIT